jgi:Txe/YoeB family toxin of Txe-Axe toxin-antitoxin module
MVEGTDKHKMINALIKMAYSKSEGQHRYTARSFSLVRKLIAEKNSEMFKGVPKSEKTRQNMKGRSGTWKRTEKHRLSQSERQKGQKGTPLSDEAKLKISKANKGNKYGLGNKSVSGLIWINNGIECKMVNPNNIPNGYVKGRKVKSNA